MAFCHGLLLPVLPLYVSEFGVSYWLIGLVLAGSELGLLLGDLPASLFIRRFGQKFVMLCGLACILVSVVALFWVQSVPTAFLCRLCTGFGTALLDIAYITYLTDRVNLKNRGKAIALLGGIRRIGGFFAGPAIGGLLAALYGLRSLFLLYGVASGTAFTLVYRFMQSSQRQADPKNRSVPQHQMNLMAVVKDHYRILSIAGLGQLCAQLLRRGRFVIIPLFGADLLGLSVQEIGYIISISAMVDMVLFYPAGWIMDRWGRKYAIVPSFIIQSLGIALIPLTGNFTSLLLVACIIGFGNGISSGTMMTLGADLSPPETRSEFLSLWRLIGDTGASGGPLIVGAVADVLVLSAAALVLSGVGFTGVLIFVLLVPETLKRPQQTVSEATS